MKKCFSILAVVALAAVAAAGAIAGVNPADAIAQAGPSAGVALALGAAAIVVAGITKFVQDGDTLTLTPSAAVLNGQGFLFGACLFGVATADVASGAAGEFITEGVVDIAKTAALAIAVGDRVFWDSTNKCVNKTLTAQQQVGICTVAAIGADATVRIKLVSGLPVAT